ncbi:hypothetical protein N7449_001777 [Penicillium cf. viridicatum]|uniref:Uncharacterized protein n=1 Tax=Penicillium cf. viridicatum TaxID=2972119 RepID=A0A9W9T9K8_9EURO|nr:hypothetical protein N7449_001777 [Penicillium cf. viridicatum]
MSCCNNITNNNSDSKSQEMGYPTKPSSWMKDAHDLPKTVPLFAIIYSIYLLGQLLYRKTAKCTKCTEAEQHAQTAEAQSRDHAIRSELSQISARDANTRAKRLAMEVKYRDWRLAEAEREGADAYRQVTDAQPRVVEAERRPSDWNFNFPATVLEPLSYPASARLHREDSMHTQASSRLGQLLRPRRRGVERSDSLESGKPFFRFPDDT